MPSKLKKALEVVKDQTSIGLAKVSTRDCSDLDVAILKATTHEEIPIDDRYITELILLTSSSKAYTAACVRALARRIARTHSWVVATKALTITINLLQCPGPAFVQEVVDAMNYGTKLLDLSGFRDTSSSSPWDYTAFVRTFALYLSERLNYTMEGRKRETMNKNYEQRRRSIESLELDYHDAKPSVMLAKVSAWQRLLERAIATRPTGPAKNNKLVQVSLYTIIRETFNLYRRISEGLACLLHTFPQLPQPASLGVLESFKKSAKQFGELEEFYGLCRSIGIGRMADYPNVQKISQTTLHSLKDFIHCTVTKPSSLPQVRHSPTPALAAGAKKQNQGAKRAEEESLSAKKTQVKQEKQGERLTNSEESDASKCMTEQLLLNPQKQQNSHSFGSKRITDNVSWELALLDCANIMSEEIDCDKATTMLEALRRNDLNDQPHPNTNHEQTYSYNPFLQVGNDSGNKDQHTVSTLFTPSLPPTFVARKNETEFNQQLLNHAEETDPFTIDFAQAPDSDAKHKVVQEQRLWMQNQSKILMRHNAL